MNNVRFLTQSLSILGTVEGIEPEKNQFSVETRGGSFMVQVNGNTRTDSLRNLDNLGGMRERKDKKNESGADWKFMDQIFEGDLISAYGIWHHHEGKERFDAVLIRLLHSSRGYLYFEHPKWWARQLTVMANKWLDDLFGDRRTYQIDDFAALYRTNLNILGLPTDDDTQEMATLSRLLYGLSSTYMVSGDERYYRAAEAGVAFQQQEFRTYSTDRRYCFWYHAIKREKYRNRTELASTNWDDEGSIPLYEQIYALAGLAMYYRITGDWDVLSDIRLTLRAMLEVWGDWKEDAQGMKYLDGFFSHVDPLTFTVHDTSLRLSDGRDNRSTKNWNSIGDHIPAYLINLILALDPLPEMGDGDECEGFNKEMKSFLGDCVNILTTTAGLIRERFPEESSPYVQERFRKKTTEGGKEEDWVVDKTWGWQRDLAVVGHNFKIAWNLTRVGNWYLSKDDSNSAEACFDLARKLGVSMNGLGVDQIRSGVYDTVQRDTSGLDIPLQFGWENTKDFWQQEQGILANLILYGQGQNADEAQARKDYLSRARELSAFWNLHFLDRERSGVFFRVNDNGQPIIEGQYGNIGNHAKSGYHVFELGFLAHVYQMAYLPRKIRQHTSFALNFRPALNSGLRALNVLPDYVHPGALEIQSVIVNGVPRSVENIKNFQIPLRKTDLGNEIVVNMWQSKAQFEQLEPLAQEDTHLTSFPLRWAEPEGFGALQE